MKDKQVTNDELNQTDLAPSKERKFAEMVKDTVNKILDRFLSRHPREKELRDFMDDEKNLYNEDGSLTEAYKQQIKEMEDYVQSNSIDDDIIELLAKNDIEESMYSSIIRFVDQRAEIIKQYKKSEDLEEEDFSAEDFVNTLLKDESYTEEERKQILETMERLAEEDSLEALDDEFVRNSFKMIINKNDDMPE